MSPDQSPNLQLAPTDGGITSSWTTEVGDLHLHDHGFDDYGTEVISVAADYNHRTDIKALDWETTHRKWTGETWRIDFAALDTTVEHFLDRGYSVTIDGAELRLFLSDYDAPSLETHVPEESPPDSGEQQSDQCGQPGLEDF